MAQTGKGASAAFGTTTLSLTLKEIDLGEEARPAIEDTGLASTKKTRVPGDLADPGMIKLKYYFDQSASNARPSTTSTPETLTVTFPLKSGETNGATFAGTGMITRVGRPKLIVGTLMEGELDFQLDGRTGPTHTAGS